MHFALNIYQNYLGLGLQITKVMKLKIGRYLWGPKVNSVKFEMPTLFSK